MSLRLQIHDRNRLDNFTVISHDGAGSESPQCAPLRTACRTSQCAALFCFWELSPPCLWRLAPGPIGTIGPVSISTLRLRPDAPCGVGTPPRGHFPREVSPASLPQGLTLTVRQDAHRLCYVSGNIAEAPTLRLRQGADFSVTLRNDISDPAAIANFVAVNELDTPNEAVPAADGYYPVVPAMHHAATGATNLHMHGFAVPPVVPQDEVIKTCADPAVGPARCGQREIGYHYHIPADMPAGLYWYHPHVHGEVHAQMLMGLSGAVVVEGPEDDARRAAGIQDRIFIIRQSQDIDVKTAIAAPAAVAEPDKMPEMHGVADAPVPTRHEGGQTVDTAHEQACSDNTGLDEITLNGSKVIDGAVADSDLAPISMGAGTTQLWRILNAANDAFLDLALIDDAGKPLPITVVARDGNPLEDDAGNRVPPVATTQSQFVPPAGRLEFLISAPPVGQKVYFVTHAVDTGCTGDKVPERKLALIKTIATATATATPPQPPAAPARPDLYTGLLARPTDPRARHRDGRISAAGQAGPDRFLHCRAQAGHRAARLRDGRPAADHDPRRLGRGMDRRELEQRVARLPHASGAFPRARGERQGGLGWFAARRRQRALCQSRR